MVISQTLNKKKSVYNLAHHNRRENISLSAVVCFCMSYVYEGRRCWLELTTKCYGVSWPACNFKQCGLSVKECHCVQKPAASWGYNHCSLQKMLHPCFVFNIYILSLSFFCFILTIWPNRLGKCGHILCMDALNWIIDLKLHLGPAIVTSEAFCMQGDFTPNSLPLSKE